ncbi:MAG: hypothetical protein PWQ87_42 [Candidatus Woesearchaeota archaeon]|nr:hypothetical protein [Candidatus Woesearchaeota archaeon]
MKLYSPPIISLKQKLVLGHGVNIVWNDVIGRYMRSKGEKIQYFYPSWNHQGKRADQLDSSELEKKILALEQDMRRELSCFGIEESYTLYRDTDEISKKNSQKYFMQLIQRGFIVEHNGEYLLDLSRIYTKTRIKEHLESVRYNPPHLKKRIFDLTKTLTGLYPISKRRRYATPIPNSVFSINPIFDLAVSPALFSEEPVDYCIDGNRTLLRGTFIPFAIWSALFDKPFARNCCAHGFLNLTDGLENMKIEKIKKSIGDPIIDSDVLRYCVLLPTNSLKDMIINQDTLMKGKKMIYRASNLAKYFVKHYGPQQNNQQGDEEIEKMIETMRIPFAMEIFRNRIYWLSKKIERGEKTTEDDIKEYQKLIKSISPIFPSTVKRIDEILKWKA